MAAEGRDRPRHRHRLAHSSRRGRIGLAFRGVSAEEKPSRANEGAVYREPDEGVLRLSCGIEAQADVANHRRRVVDLAVRGDRSRAVGMNVYPETLASAL